MKLKQIYFWLLNIGVEQSDNSLLARQVRATNFIILVGVIFQLPLVIFNFSNDILADRLILTVYSFFCIIYLWANHKKLYNIARIGFLLITTLVIMLMADLQDRASGIAINFLIPFMITFLIFSFQEKLKIIISVFFIILCYALLETFDYDLTGINRFKSAENLKVDYLYNAFSTLFALVLGMLYYSYQFYTTEKSMQESLMQAKLSEEITNAVIETNNNLIWIIDKDYNLIKFNNLFKFSYEAGFGVSVFEGYKLIDDLAEISSIYYPSWKQSQHVYKQNYDKCFAGENFTVHDEIEILDNTVYLENSFYNIKISNETSYVAVFSKDVTAKVLYDKKLNQNLIEKELLLKEIHHRVKNNMQIIIGLLQLQELYVNDEKINPIFNDINNRVKAMSLVHELLYQSDDLSFIDFNSYVVKLCKHISSSYKESASKIEFVFESQPHFLTIDTAIPLGLLVNELLTNALKYAFNGRENGKIELGVKEEKDKFVFYFSDNGIGLPQSIDFENATTLGLNLIHRLASQINAELQITTTKGTTFYLTLDTKN